MCYIVVWVILCKINEDVIACLIPTGKNHNLKGAINGEDVNFYGVLMLMITKVCI